jgi:hypothetical protein
MRFTTTCRGVIPTSILDVGSLISLIRSTLVLRVWLLLGILLALTDSRFITMTLSPPRVYCAHTIWIGRHLTCFFVLQMSY